MDFPQNWVSLIGNITKITKNLGNKPPDITVPEKNRDRFRSPDDFSKSDRESKFRICEHFKCIKDEKIKMTKQWSSWD